MSLEICDNGHAEIAYQAGGMFSGRNSCPVCDAISERDAIQEELDAIGERE